jgi:BRCT domain type II-containing protein
LVVQYLIKPEPASGGTGKDGEKAGEKSAQKPHEITGEKKPATSATTARGSTVHTTAVFAPATAEKKHD